jgi:DNA (cytosine-5)-methyltransferase 1
MTAGSLFSGVGGFDLALEWCGVDVRWQIERDKDCLAVLTKHWPTVRRVTDIHAVAYGRHRNRVKHGLMLEPVDVLVGGFPCQDLSVAGKREGLGGARSGLFFAFMRMVRLLKPPVVIVENVPGLLSSRRGRDFHTVLATLAQLGFFWAYRVLDSQFFGVAQRRRRVFIVGCHRTSGLDPRAILFESVGGERHSPARRAARADVAPCLESGTNRTGGIRPPGSTVDTAESLIVGPLGGGNDGIGRRTEDDPNLVYPLSSDCASGRSGTADTPSADAEGRVRLRPPSLGVGRAGDPSFSLTTGAVPAIFSSGERGRALTSSMHKRHDEDTDTLVLSTSGDISRPLKSGGNSRHDESHETFVAATITGEWDRGPRGDGSDNLIAATLNSGGNDGGFRTEPGEHLITVDDTLSNQGFAAIVSAYADAKEADADQVLRLLREAVDSPEGAGRRFRELAPFWTPEVLQSSVFCEGTGREAECDSGMVHNALSCQEDGPGRSMRDMREGPSERCPSSRQGPYQQRQRQFAADLSGLSYSHSSGADIVRHLRAASEGARLLQQALYSLEEARRSARAQDPSTEDVFGVRESGSQQGPVRQALHGREAGHEKGGAGAGVRRLTPL